MGDGGLTFFVNGLFWIFHVCYSVRGPTVRWIFGRVVVVDFGLILLSRFTSGNICLADGMFGTGFFGFVPAGSERRFLSESGIFVVVGGVVGVVFGCAFWNEPAVYWVDFYYSMNVGRGWLLLVANARWLFFVFGIVVGNAFNRRHFSQSLVC